eukprot:CAMPEP_0114529432 /NCGR_PEP_ID=MMETSP0109-20121206/24831_1 /TAXON_ID=29199 /ORGANISM="Chlorarachnion reptans, Strain CCCM449" /LENGTH=143 /DNA_ID=CAMNT_0001711833 /DNA_START=11 /DNA_END=442 /DNA_ORIENTATION=+
MDVDDGGRERVTVHTVVQVVALEVKSYISSLPPALICERPFDLPAGQTRQRIPVELERSLKECVEGLEVRSSVGDLPKFRLKFNFKHNPQSYTFGIGHSVFDRRTLQQHYFHAYQIRSPLSELVMVSFISKLLRRESVCNKTF